MSAPGAVIGTNIEEGGEVSPLVISETRDSLQERRRQILASLGMTAEEFEQLAASRTLTGEEYDAREELDEIAFLLGE
jgi:hypothetical protein